MPKPGLLLVRRPLILSSAPAAAQPPAFRSASSGSGGGSTVSTSLPEGWQPGDYAILAVVEGTGGVSQTVPPGWTRIYGPIDAQSCGLAVYVRRLQGGDSAPSITLGSAENHGWIIVAYSGVSGTGDGYDELVSATPSASSTQTLTGIDAAGDDRLTVVIFAADPPGSLGTFDAAPQSATERAESYGSTAAYLKVADREQDAGTISQVWNLSASNGCQLIALPLIPA